MMKCSALIVGLLSIAAMPARAEVASPLDPSPAGCITSQSSPDQKAAAADRTMQALLAPRADMPALPDITSSSQFAMDMGPLTKENVFGNIWSRCGLSRRDRSLVTLGILIALRAENELRFHFPIAIRNGLTSSELEEVIFQASGYAGFPAAATARTIAGEAIGKLHEPGRR